MGNSVIGEILMVFLVLALVIVISATIWSCWLLLFIFLVILYRVRDMNHLMFSLRVFQIAQAFFLRIHPKGFSEILYTVWSLCLEKREREKKLPFLQNELFYPNFRFKSLYPLFLESSQMFFWDIDCR